MSETICIKARPLARIIAEIEDSLLRLKECRAEDEPEDPMALYDAEDDYETAVNELVTVVNSAMPKEAIA